MRLAFRYGTKFETVLRGMCVPFLLYLVVGSYKSLYIFSYKDNI